MASFSLPMPPSTNALYANARGRGRVKTGAYRAWIKEAGQMLNLAHIPAATSRVCILIQAKTNNRRDADNLIKPVADLLVKHGVIKKDSAAYVASVTSEWRDDVAGCRVTLTEAK